MAPLPSLSTIESVIIEKSSKSLQDFLDCLIVQASPIPKRFCLIRDEWQQREILDPLVPAVEHAAGIRPEYRGPQWFQFFLPRGHAKTSVQAMLVIWALVFSRTYCGVTCAAADKDQAKELKKAIETIQRLNWWLKDRIEVQRDGVKGEKGDLEIISSDAASSYGKCRHIYICDEFTVWGDNEPLFGSLHSGADKIPEAAFIITSNAGYKGTWQEKILDTGRNDPRHWHVFEAPGHLASWMSEDTREAKRVLMMPGEARRVLDNHWIPLNEAGDFVTDIEVAACQEMSRSRALTYMYRAAIGTRYVGAIDYGPKRDRTVAVVLHRDEVTGQVIIDQMRIWKGADFPELEVPIAVVEEWIEEIHTAFHLRLLVVDKYEMSGTIQKYESRMCVERFEPRGGKANYEMAVLLRKLIVSRQLLWYPDAGLLKVGDGRYESFADELLSVQLKTTPYGFRIDNVVSGTHDDRCFIAGTMIETIAGPRPIETIRPGDLVLTRQGYKPVLLAGCTGVSSVVTLRLRNGWTLTGTPNHPIFSQNDWRDLASLSDCDNVHTWKVQSLSTMALPTDATPIPNVAAIASISRLTPAGKARFATSIGTCGPTPTVPSRRAARSTTKTATRSTTSWTIWNASHQASTPNAILTATAAIATPGIKRKQVRHICETSGNVSRNGNVRSQPRSVPDHPKLVGVNGSPLIPFVLNAGLSTRPIGQPKRNTAQLFATSEPGTNRDVSPWSENAPSARVSTKPTSTDRVELAPLPVQQLCDEPLPQRVYNLTVADAEEYFANGILVHNCVAVGMACVGLNTVPHVTNLAMSTVERHRTERTIMGVSTDTRTDQQRLYDQVHRTGRHGKPPSSAERRGLYGRGRK